MAAAAAAPPAEQPPPPPPPLLLDAISSRIDMAFEVDSPAPTTWTKLCGGGDEDPFDCDGPRFLDAKVLRCDTDDSIPHPFIVLSDGQNHVCGTCESHRTLEPILATTCSSSPSLSSTTPLPRWVRVTDCDWRVADGDLAEVHVKRLEPLHEQHRRAHEVVLSTPLGLVGQLEVNGDETFVARCLAAVVQAGSAADLSELLRWSHAARRHVNDVMPSTGAPPLHYCCFFGHHECVRVLLSLNDSRTGDAGKPLALDAGLEGSGGTPFYIACQKGEVEIAELLLDAGRGDFGYDDGDAALDDAAHFSDWWRRRLDVVVSTGHTPLGISVEEGRADVIKLILDRAEAKRKEEREAGERSAPLLQASSEDGALPLVNWACERGHVAALRELLRPRPGLFVDADPLLSSSPSSPPRGFSDPNELSPSGLPALFAAISYKERKHLSEAGPPPYSTSAAALSTRLQLVQVLLEAGAFPDALTGAEQTPLYLAAQFGSADLVRLLATFGARADKSHGAGWTPIDIAAEVGTLEVVKVLVRELGCVATTMSLLFASAAGDEAMVTLLLESLSSSSSPSSSSPVTLPPSRWAELRLPLAVVETYIGSQRARCVSTTPLRAAAAHNRSRVVGLLVAAGADPNEAEGAAAAEDAVVLLANSGVSGASGRGGDYSSPWPGSSNPHAVIAPTALHVAVARGSVEVLQALLRHGADAEQATAVTRAILDGVGDSALAMACRLGGARCGRLVRVLLREGGADGGAPGTGNAVPVLLAVLQRNEEALQLLLTFLEEQERADVRASALASDDDPNSEETLDRRWERRRRWLDCPTSENGMTALLLACASGQRMMAMRLARAGANHQPHPTLNASDVAAANGHHSLARWLRRSRLWTSVLHFASSPIVHADDVASNLLEVNYDADGGGANNFAALRVADPAHPTGGEALSQRHIDHVFGDVLMEDMRSMPSAGQIARGLVATGLSELTDNANGVNGGPSHSLSDSSFSSRSSSGFAPRTSVSNALRLVVDASQPWSPATHRHCWPLPLRRRVRFLLLVCGRIIGRLAATPDRDGGDGGGGGDNNLADGRPVVGNSSALLPIFVQWILPAAMDRPHGRER